MQCLQNLTRTILVAAILSGFAPILSGSLPVIGAGEASAATVSRIIVRGNTRVEASTVESYLTIRPGRPYGPSDVDESLKTLFATGLFGDVSINRQGNALVVTVTENPMVNRISFEGNKRLNDNFCKNSAAK